MSGHLSGFYPPSQPWLQNQALWNRWTVPNASWLYQGPVAPPYGADGTTTPTATAPDQLPPAQPGASGTGAGYSEYLQQTAQVLAAYKSGQDVRVQREALVARIANYRAMAAKTPFLRSFYDNQIRVMEAKVRALDEKLALTHEGEAAQRDWRSLGQTGVAFGIIGGAALIALLAAMTIRVARS